MTKETLNGVANYYGPRHRHEGVNGVVRTDGTLKQAVIRFGGDTYSYVSFVLPAGASLVGKALLQVDEVFSMGGTTPHLVIGVDTTDYIAQPAKADLEALGTYNYASAGVFAEETPLLVDKTIIVGLEGDSTIVASGKATVTFQYRVI